MQFVCDSELEQIQGGSISLGVVLVVMFLAGVYDALSR
jgi:hypothetical protein